MKKNSHKNDVKNRSMKIQKNIYDEKFYQKRR